MSTPSRDYMYFTPASESDDEDAVGVEGLALQDQRMLQPYQQMQGSPVAVLPPNYTGPGPSAPPNPEHEMPPVAKVPPAQGHSGNLFQSHRRRGKPSFMQAAIRQSQDQRWRPSGRSQKNSNTSSEQTMAPVDNDQEQPVQQSQQSQQQQQSQTPQQSQQQLQQRRVRESNVNMPSGQAVSVVIPAKRCSCKGNCTYDLRVVELRPNGAMSGKEYNVVCSEMSSTMRQHSAPERGGGRFRSYNIIKIEKIQNCCLWRKFRARESQLFNDVGYVNEKMLFHGSPAADDIVKYGFAHNEANQGGMFGPAFYLTEISSKSNQYAYGSMGGNGCPAHSNKSCYTCERKMILCRVALGKMHRLKTSNKMRNPPSGFHSVMGVPSPGGLRYSEYAIYDASQAYPEYLITYKIVQ